MGYESVYWIHLSQHTYEWRAFMNMEIDLRVSYKVKNVLSGQAILLRWVSDCPVIICIQYRCAIPNSQWRIFVLLYSNQSAA
jgi:hypothetical protein